MNALLKSGQPELIYSKALEYYQKEKWQRASTLFEGVQHYYTGSSREDSISFFNARCKYKNRDFDTASTLLDDFRRKFGRSAFIEDAEGMYALCFYYLSPGPSRDQTMTGHALIAINEFMSRYPKSDRIEDFKKINEELVLYSEKLAKRPMLVVANKMDLPDAEENFKKLEAYVTAQGYPIMKASAATGQGLREIMWKAYEMLQKAPAEEEVIDIGKVEEADPDSFTILRDTEDADFEVKGKNIERLVAMTNFDNEEAVYRFQLIWRRLGIEKALKEKGIQEGQSVKIGDMVFDYEEQ